MWKRENCSAAPLQRGDRERLDDRYSNDEDADCRIYKMLTAEMPPIKTGQHFWSICPLRAVLFFVAHATKVHQPGASYSYRFVNCLRKLKELYKTAREKNVCR